MICEVVFIKWCSRCEEVFLIAHRHWIHKSHDGCIQFGWARSWFWSLTGSRDRTEQNRAMVSKCLLRKQTLCFNGLRRVFNILGVCCCGRIPAVNPHNTGRTQHDGPHRTCSSPPLIGWHRWLCSLFFTQTGNLLNIFVNVCVWQFLSCFTVKNRAQL